jgi:hypothetical protein
LRELLVLADTVGKDQRPISSKKNFGGAEYFDIVEPRQRRLSRGLAATQCRVGGSTISRWTP